MPRAPIPRPEATNTSIPLCECFFLMSATASPSGTDPGAAMAPSWTVAELGSRGMMAESGRLIGAGGGTVVVVDESFGFLFLSALAAVVVVGAGAAEVGVWTAAGP